MILILILIVAETCVQAWLNEQPNSPASVPSVTQGFHYINFLVVYPLEILFPVLLKFHDSYFNLRAVLHLIYSLSTFT